MTRPRKRGCGIPTPQEGVRSTYPARGGTEYLEACMKKALIRALIVCLLIGSVWTAWTLSLAASPLLQAMSRIASPSENQMVRGVVPIVGSALDPQFWKYEVHYATEPNPREQWVGIGGVHETAVQDGLLETWDTTIIPDGTYTLRLRVVDKTGNYREVFVHGVQVVNAAPTETPQPRATPIPIPTATLTPAATPTFIIPTSPLAQPSATPTLARPTRSALPDVLDVNAWRQSVCLGVELMAALLVVIALIFLLRRLF
jgi:hypothetical protein